MNSKPYSLVYLVLAIVLTSRVHSQGPSFSAMNMFPGVSWQATNGNIYRVERSSTVTGDWHLVQWHYSKSNEIKTVVDTSPTTDHSYFYRVVMATNSPGTGFTETFEDDSGWSDIPPGVWTSVVASGTWKAGLRGTSIEPVYTASNPTRAHSGTRYVGITDPMSTGFLELPSINNPTSVHLWVKGGSTVFSSNIWLYYHDGFSWLYFHGYTIYGNTYSQIVFDVSSLGFPNPMQRLGIRMSTSTAIYIDDITALTQP